MTLDEAILHSEQIADSYKDTEPNCKCAEDHRQLAKWLKELKGLRTMTDDLISRADAIKAICEDGTWLERQGCYEITMAERKQRDADILSGIPSAQPKQGEWIKRTHDTLISQVNFAYCSECGQPIMHEHTRPLWNYCPNCGARMRETHDIHTNTHECVKKPKVKKPCTNCEYHDWIWDEHFGYGSVCNGIGRCPYNVEETITSDQTERSE